MSSFLGQNHLVDLDLAQVSSTAKSEKYQWISHNENVGKIQCTKMIQNVYRSSCKNMYCSLEFDIMTMNTWLNTFCHAKSNILQPQRT